MPSGEMPLFAGKSEFWWVQSVPKLPPEVLVIPMNPQSSHSPSPAVELGCNPHTTATGFAKSASTVGSVTVKGTTWPPGAVTVPALSLVNFHVQVPRAVEFVNTQATLV